MTGIFVFGDSFAIRTHLTWAWPRLLEQNYTVYNRAVGGSSCSAILEKLKESISSNEIASDDFIVLCLSDKTREYMEIADPEWNTKTTEKYNLTLNEIKSILENFRHVVIWGFPSDYGDSGGWLNEKFSYIDKDSYVYNVGFKNEIKPALIYYSRQEYKNIRNHKQMSRIFSNDRRPNHIGNDEIHKKIFGAVLEFVNGTASGCIDLGE